MPRWDNGPIDMEESATACGAPVHLTGWGTHHPPDALSNRELADRVPTTADWIDRHLAIGERRRSAADATIADVAHPAVDAARLRAGDPPIDLVIASTNFDEMIVPPASSRIAAATGMDAPGFDVRAGCSGFLAALDVAAAMIRADRARCALVVAAEIAATTVHALDRTSQPIFGDGAAAAVVEATPNPARSMELVAVGSHADATMHEAVCVPRLGWFEMDGHATRDWVLREAPRLARELCGTVGVAPGDLRAVAFHQANGRLIQDLAEAVEVPPERHLHNVAWAGNTAAASGPTALFEGVDATDPELEPGDLLLLVTVGAGLNAYGALFRWWSGAPR